MDHADVVAKNSNYLQSNYSYESVCNYPFSKDGVNAYSVIDHSKTLKYDHGNGMPETFIRLRVGSKDRHLLGEYMQTLQKGGGTEGESFVKQIVGPVLICKCPVLSTGMTALYSKNKHIKLVFFLGPR